MVVPMRRPVLAAALAVNGSPGATDVTTARGLAAKFLALKEQLVPASFWWLWGILLGMLVVGLIVPLTYLSAQDAGSKFALIIAFSLLSLAFFAFLAYELRRLRLAADLTRATF